MGKILSYLQNRLREKSTWIGIFMVASAWGFNLTPEQVAALSFLGMALAGAPGDTMQRLSPPKQDDAKPVEFNKIKEQVKADADKALIDIINDDQRD